LEGVEKKKESCVILRGPSASKSRFRGEIDADSEEEDQNGFEINSDLSRNAALLKVVTGQKKKPTGILVTDTGP